MDEARVLDGRYRLVREIAAGGMGVVHEAEHLGLRKRVALKLLKREVADVPGVAARFEREARATSLLDNPHVVRVTDFGRTAEGELYLVMDLLEGRSLGGLLTETPRLAPDRAIALVDQVLAGLAAAHDAGLVHRDLKPDNVFVSGAARSEHARILDFGIAAARSEQDGTKLTVVGSVMGTPAYMSPEQASGRVDLDGRTDLYAVGAILYEMLAGCPAYGGDNYNQILHAVVQGARPPLDSLRDDLPTSLCGIVDRAMSTHASERYASAAAFRSALRSAHEPPYSLPARLDVTDLKGSGVQRDPVEANPWGPSPHKRTGRVTSPIEPALYVAEDVAPLELDRSAAAPTPPALPPVERPFPSTPLLVACIAVVLGVGGFFGWRAFMGKSEVTIDLTNVPPGARLSLDGTPLIGRRLVLPRGGVERVLRVDRGHDAPHTIKFATSDDSTIDVGAALR